MSSEQGAMRIMGHHTSSFLTWEGRELDLEGPSSCGDIKASESDSPPRALLGPCSSAGGGRGRGASRFGVLASLHSLLHQDLPSPLSNCYIPGKSSLERTACGSRCSRS